MKDWVTRHPLSSYFLVAYAVSWSIAVPLALQAQGVLPDRLPWSLHYLTLDGLHLDRIFLAGQSYGACLALNFAIAAPERVQKLVLLSPGGGFVRMARQFSLRGMLMVWFPTRVTVNWFMRWLGITAKDARSVLELNVPRSEAFSSSRRDVACHARFVP